MCDRRCDNVTAHYQCKVAIASIEVSITFYCVVGDTCAVKLVQGCVVAVGSQLVGLFESFVTSTVPIDHIVHRRCTAQYPLDLPGALVVELSATRYHHRQGGCLLDSCSLGRVVDNAVGQECHIRNGCSNIEYLTTGVVFDHIGLYGVDLLARGVVADQIVIRHFERFIEVVLLHSEIDCRTRMHHRSESSNICLRKNLGKPGQLPI